jgi:hypothetical protein
MIDDYLDICGTPFRKREAAKNEELYFRPYPDSREAWLEIEEGDPDVYIGCSLDIRSLHYDFVWHREKSNQPTPRTRFAGEASSGVWLFS